MFKLIHDKYILFTGHITPSNMKKLQEESFKHAGDNMTLYYSHYPISSISGASQIGLNSLIGKYGNAYFCGHLHTLGGHRMHAMHSTGMLSDVSM